MTNSGEITQTSGRFRHLALTWLPAVVVCACFYPLLTCDFTSWDDYQTVARNWRLAPPTFESLKDYWVRAYMDLYVPVTHTVWWVIAAIVGEGETGRLPAGVFHGVNVVVHAVNAVLVYVLVRRWVGVGRWGALVAALVFGVHPVQVESVGWVSGLKDVLYGFFSLVALLAYARSWERRRRGVMYGVATVSFVLAMLSKPTAVVVPVMAFVVDWGLLGRGWRVAVGRLWVWVVLAVPCLIWTRMVQEAHLTEAAAWWQRPFVAGDAVAFYLGKVVWPVGLAIDYGRTPGVIRGSGAMWWTWVIPVGVVVGMLLLRGWWRRGAIVAGALFVLPLVPVLGFVPFDFQAISTVADHYLYLSMVGVAVGVALLLRGRDGVARGSLAVVVVLGGLAWRQTFYWRDNAALFGRVLEVNPRSWVARDSLAAEALERGDWAGAEGYARESLKIKPEGAAGAVHLAAALSRTGREGEALAVLRAAAGRDERSPEVAVELGSLMAQMGEPGAEAALRRAMERAPEHPAPPMNLGTLLLSRGQAGEAVGYLERAVKLSPRDAQGRTNLAIALVEVGRREEAVGQLRRALEVEPGYGAAREVLREIEGGGGR